MERRGGVVGKEQTGGEGKKLEKLGAGMLAFFLPSVSFHQVSRSGGERRVVVVVGRRRKAKLPFYVMCFGML